MNLSIIIPAYNEEKRVKNTLQSYCSYFAKHYSNYEIIVVLNGCTDTTQAIVQKAQQTYSQIKIIDLGKKAGKGLAIIAGFKDAITRNNELIGFVDADMATRPEYFYDLVKNINQYDGAIASRYMLASYIEPKRPWIKRVGSWLIYESLVFVLFGLRYNDLQCGAKLLKKEVIQTVVYQLTVKQWAFDVELLYLCKKYGFKITEIPTTWYDQTGSKLNMLRGGLKMLSSLFAIRFRHWPWSTTKKQ